jgi:hypothetical protein
MNYTQIQSKKVSPHSDVFQEQRTSRSAPDAVTVL